MAEVSDLLSKIQQQGGVQRGATRLDFDPNSTTENNGGAKLQAGSRGRLSSRYIPMIMTTDYQVSLGSEGKHILFWSGPSNTSWSFVQRGVFQQTRSGTITHYWRDSRRSTFFDEPTVTFGFQTGNIMPIRIVDGSDDVISLPPGLLDYYDFFTMLDEQKILSDGRPNFVNIVYHSLLYPTILLRGFFDPSSSINVDEDVSNPASVNWSGTFRVKTSDPPLYDAYKLKLAWEDSIVNASRTLNQTPNAG